VTLFRVGEAALRGEWEECRRVSCGRRRACWTTGAGHRTLAATLKVLDDRIERVSRDRFKKARDTKAMFAFGRGMGFGEVVVRNRTWKCAHRGSAYDEPC
jgi:hypothetical protein